MIRDHRSGSDDFSNVKDLVRDPIVMWQHKYYIELVVVTNIALPLLIGYLFSSALGVFLLAGLLRLVLVHHLTFFINSLAHIWASQPYSDANSSRDNPILPVLTFGEGYHNYHHSFQGDYRNGIRWWNFDPSKWAITALSWIGLTSRLKRQDHGVWVPQGGIDRLILFIVTWDQYLRGSAPYYGALAQLERKRFLRKLSV